MTKLQEILSRITLEAGEPGANHLELGKQLQALIDQGYQKKAFTAAAGRSSKYWQKYLLLANAPADIQQLYVSGACKNLCTLRSLDRLRLYDLALFESLYQKALASQVDNIEVMVLAQEARSKHTASLSKVKVARK